MRRLVFGKCFWRLSRAFGHHSFWSKSRSRHILFLRLSLIISVSTYRFRSLCASTWNTWDIFVGENVTQILDTNDGAWFSCMLPALSFLSSVKWPGVLLRYDLKGGTKTWIRKLHSLGSSLLEPLTRNQLLVQILGWRLTDIQRVREWIEYYG